MADLADLAFIGGPVFTGDAARSWAHGLAVGGSRIVAMGDQAALAERIGPATRVVELDGRLLCPGFQDAHVHPGTGGHTLLTCDLTGAGTLAEAVEIIRRYGVVHAEDSWVWGGGWQFAWFPAGLPTRQLLDDLVPDRPAYLRAADGHAGWANTAALAAAGIDRGTPDPGGGRIERNPDGSIQGTLQEDGAMTLVERLEPRTASDLDRFVLRGQDHLMSLGITAWQDAWVEPSLHQAYVGLASSGRLRASVRGALWWDPEEGVDDQLERIVSQRGESQGRYVAGTVKLMLDGVVENFTARMLSPYVGADGRAGDGSGMQFFEPNELRHIVTEIVRLGFQPHFHALGDAAVRDALDAVEAARAEVGWTDVRPHVAHIQVVDPSDVPRFRSLGVAATMQPLWACNEDAMVDLTLPFLSPGSAAHQYPFRSLRDAGTTLAAGSDWSVSTPDVMHQIDVAVRRQVIEDRSRPVFIPEQRLTIGDALAAFTSGSSYVNHLAPERGVAAVGAIADLVVLGGNPFTDADIAGIPVDMTVIDGEIVFER